MSEPSIKRVRLLGLPCPKCGACHSSDEPYCPVCEARRPNSQQPTGSSEHSIRRKRLLGLPCPKCGACYFTDEPKKTPCPVCESRRVQPTAQVHVEARG